MTTMTSMNMLGVTDNPANRAERALFRLFSAICRNCGSKFFDHSWDAVEPPTAYCRWVINGGGSRVCFEARDSENYVALVDEATLGSYAASLTNTTIKIIKNSFTPAVKKVCNDYD